MSEQVRILAEGLDLPNGPAFSSGSSLWYVETNGGNLACWSEEGGLERYPTGGAPTGLVFDGFGRAWICDAGQNAIRRFDLQSGQWETMIDTIDGQPLAQPHSLAFDRAGNLVFTCQGEPGRAATGYACCLRPDGSLTRIAPRLDYPGGLAFIGEGRQLVMAEMHRQRLWVGGWDAGRANWEKPKPWISLTGDPGGLAEGENGLLYVAVAGAGQVMGVNMSGRINTRYDVPGRQPTNLAFDPSPDFPLGLVVTEAELGLLVSLPHLGPGVPLCDGGQAWK